jgi:hypothetical protein
LEAELLRAEEDEFVFDLAAGDLDFGFEAESWFTATAVPANSKINTIEEMRNFT